MRRRVTVALLLASVAATCSIGAAAQERKPATTVSPAPAASAAPSSAGTAATTATGASSGSGGATPAASSASAAGPTPAAGPTTPAPAPAVTVDMNARPPEQAMNGATYAVRLRDLEQRVDELKDQIRRSHTRLALLSDTIIGGGAAGSRAEVNFKDEMSSAFLLTQALFVLDGQVQYNRQDDSGALADQKDIPIYSGSVPPGDHTLTVQLTFQGNGYGVFSYLRGYKFNVKSSHSFTALEGKTLTITATAFEKGGVTTPLEQRPTIEWHEKVQPLSFGAPAAGGSAAGAGGGAGGINVSGGVSGGASAGGGKK